LVMVPLCSEIPLASDAAMPKAFWVF
jgi:hypothetical protein